MSKNTTLTPLEGINDLEHDRLRFGLNFPDYAPLDQIGINISRLDRIARLANIGSLTVKFYDGDVTSYEPTVEGVDDQGTAFAGGRARATEADLQTSRVDHLEEEFLAYDEDLEEVRRNTFELYKKRDAVIDLNINEIEERITAKARKRKKGSLHNPTSWSSELDRALRDGANEVLHKVFIKEPSKKAVELVGAYGILTLFTQGTISVVAYLPKDSPPPQSVNQVRLTTGLITYGVFKATEYIYAAESKPKVNFKDVNLSILPYWHLDRYLGAKALNGALKLVKPIESPKG